MQLTFSIIICLLLYQLINFFHLINMVLDFFKYIFQFLHVLPPLRYTHSEMF